MVAELASTKDTNSLKGLFESQKSKIAEVAPKHLSPDRLMRVALMTIGRTPALAKCSPLSLLGAFMEASRLGLEVGGSLGEAYLVPYGTNATFIVGYRGLINLARRSGQIASLESQVVRDGDEFEFEYGLEQKFRHVPRSSTKDITHAWALARFKDGGVQVDVMTVEEIDAIRKRSRASNNGPWVTDFAEMAKKTVVRRLCKYLPLSPEMADAIEASDTNEFGGFIDIEPKPTTKRPFGPQDQTPPAPPAPTEPTDQTPLVDEGAQEEPPQDDVHEAPPVEEAQTPAMNVPADPTEDNAVDALLMQSPSDFKEGKSWIKTKLKLYTPKPWDKMTKDGRVHSFKTLVMEHGFAKKVGWPVPEPAAV